MKIPEGKWVFNRKVEGEAERFEPEFVDLEKFVWGVVYDDGTELHQFGNDMFFHQFKEIQLDKVKMFTVYNSENMNNRFDILVKPEKHQPFFVYKRHILEHGGDERRVTVYMFGVKDKETGNAKYHYLFPDGRLIISDEEIVDLLQFNL